MEVTDYRHKNEKRKNNPDAGLASYNYKPQQKIKYTYDPHLDPQLVWTGKAERSSFEVETVSLHIHERVSTQAILKSVQRADEWRQEKLFAEPEMPLDKRIEFYQHEMEWANRLILGDSLLVMNSLLERELMAGKVQMIYIDPPYGIAYNSNFQPIITSRDVKDGDDSSLSREPEQIQAYRDTWTLGIHSYLTYLRDRLLLCRELLHETGACFIQISDENVHLVRNLMDEVFGRENFCAIITFRKTSAQTSRLLPPVADYLLWYARSKEKVKYRSLFEPRDAISDPHYSWVEMPDGTRKPVSKADKVSSFRGRLYRIDQIASQTGTAHSRFPYRFQGKMYTPPGSRGWSTSKEGLDRLASANRLVASGKNLAYVRYADDFPLRPMDNVWPEVMGVQSRADPKVYVVQTATTVVERCILMTTDPGDLILDPTCGSGTTAYSAERWGRRWITCDTSRVAISLARQRLMTAKFDYHKLANPEKGADAGFLHETVPHVTLKSIAQNEPAKTEILYDKTIVESDKARVSGPFTVEAIPAPATVEPQKLDSKVQPLTQAATDEIGNLIELLRKDGVTFPGGKKMSMENLRPMASAGFLHAECETQQNGDKARVAVSFGPKHGPVTGRQVDEAIRSSHRLGYDVLVLAGFAFDPEARAMIEKNPFPKLKVHFANISPDVIIGDLLKATKASQLFTVFGQPDVRVVKSADGLVVRLLGVDIYNPETGGVHSSTAEEIPAWFLDEDYDGYTFRICQAFFPKEATAKNPWDKLENALRGALDREKMEMFRGTESIPFDVGPEQRIAVKVIDNRGNEVMVVKSLGNRRE